MGSFFRDFQKYKYLVYVLVVRDIKKKYRRSVLGIFWSLLNPLMMMVITAMVFSTLFRFDIENYILYLLVGQVMFSFFSEATTFSMGSILENSSLLKKVYVPKYMFPLSRVLSSCVNLFLTIPAVLIMMLYTGQFPTWRVFSFVIPLFLLLIFCLGIGLVLAASVVYFRDVFHLYGVVLTALNYATPIFYPEKIVPPEYQFLMFYNPLYYYVHAFREVLYSGGLSSIALLGPCAVLSAVALIVGILIFRKAQNQFILYV